MIAVTLPITSKRATHVREKCGSTKNNNPSETEHEMKSGTFQLQLQLQLQFHFSVTTLAMFILKVLFLSLFLP
jgi:hypothetical protein